MEKFEVRRVIEINRKTCRVSKFSLCQGNQPINGTMTIETSRHRLPGFEQDSRGTIRITYHFPNGIQDVGQIDECQ